MQQVRLYFPLLVSRQLITGVTTAYSQEIKKLRTFGIRYIAPYLTQSKLRKYPYKIKFTYYTSDETDMISVLTTTSFIIHLLENNAVLQSTDYRIIPNVEISIQKIHGLDKEGCEISVESLKA